MVDYLESAEKLEKTLTQDIEPLVLEIEDSAHELRVEIAKEKVVTPPLG